MQTRYCIMIDHSASKERVGCRNGYIAERRGYFCGATDFYPPIRERQRIYPIIAPTDFFESLQLARVQTDIAIVEVQILPPFPVPLPGFATCSFRSPDSLH